MSRTKEALNAVCHAILFGVIIGIISAIGAHYFKIGILQLSVVIDHSLTELSSFLLYFISLSLAASLVYSLKRCSRINRFEGPADSIYAAHRLDNELNVKNGIVSTLAAFISAAGGASVGQYGPIVHFGATIGAWLKRRFTTEISTDVFIGCGVAGAISSGFGAPIAGVIFAHEAITRHFSLKAITPIAISSGIAFVVTEHFWGSTSPLIQMVALSNLSFNITVIATIFTAPLFGLCAVAFMISLENCNALSQRLKVNQFTKTFVAIIILSLIGSSVPQVMGLGTSVISNTIEGNYGLIFLAFMLVGKLLATSVSLSFGFFGGIFSPALFLGATLGAIIAHVFNSLGFLEVSYPAFVISGMASVSGAVIGAPLAAVLIVFELTQSYSLSLAALVSVVIAVLVSDKFYGHSYFDRQLKKRGIDLSDGRSGLLLMEKKIIEYASQDAVLLKPDCTVQDALSKLTEKNTTEAYFTDHDKKYIGKLELLKILDVEAASRAVVYSDKNAVTLKHDASLQQAIEVAANFVGETIPIIERSTNKLRGVVTEGDIFKAYLELQTKIIDLERK